MRSVSSHTETALSSSQLHDPAMQSSMIRQKLFCSRTP
nr:MAG TPA_asm: hypothetical protein [Caudoviricetes sp.]